MHSDHQFGRDVGLMGIGDMRMGSGKEVGFALRGHPEAAVASQDHVHRHRLPSTG